MFDVKKRSHPTISTNFKYLLLRQQFQFSLASNWLDVCIKRVNSVALLTTYSSLGLMLTSYYTGSDNIWKQQIQNASIVLAVTSCILLPLSIIINRIRLSSVGGVGIDDIDPEEFYEILEED